MATIGGDDRAALLTARSHHITGSVVVKTEKKSAHLEQLLQCRQRQRKPSDGTMPNGNTERKTGNTGHSGLRGKYEVKLNSSSVGIFPLSLFNRHRKASSGKPCTGC